MSTNFLFVEKIKNILKSIPQTEQRSDSWHAQKKKIISATEISTILNCNPFQTLHNLFHQKCHPDENIEKSSESMNWGHIYEPIAKKLLKERNQNIIAIIELGLAMHPHIDYLGASPDGLIIINDNGIFHL